jgi:hypothetical protein
LFANKKGSADGGVGGYASLRKSQPTNKKEARKNYEEFDKEKKVLNFQ